MSKIIKTERFANAVALAELNSSFTSDPICIERADALSVHVQSVACEDTPEVEFTYSISDSLNGTYITPSTPVTIGDAGSADVFDFSPEAAAYIKIILKNKTAYATTVTASLVVQEEV